MKFSRIFFVFALMVSRGQAQTSSGKCFYVDYAQWCNLGYPGIFINCGNDATFNTGSQITMEVWARAYIFGENRKILGKMSPSLDNGYVLGFENLNIYTEVFNPDPQSVPHAGTGPMPTDSAWVHIATTYDANGQMVNYLNGVNVGEITVFPQAPIVANTDPFIIGLAPWDQLSYEFVGDLDEVRIWNVARTEQQIRDDMFRTLSGSESNLVAYYNFNSDVDSIVHDAAPNHLNGILHNSTSTCFSWTNSYAPVGDDRMGLMNEINGSWNGKASPFIYAVTTNGLSLITSIGNKDFRKYVIFGHDNASGKTNADAPVSAPLDFERMSRVWYVNQGGSFTSQVVFNIQDGAGGGATLTSGAPDSLYTLLVRVDTTGDFTPLYSATTVMGNTVLFDDVQLENKYYTLGHSSQKLAPTASVKEHTGGAPVIVYPNPARDRLFITLPEDARITLSDLTGKILRSVFMEQGERSLSVAGLPAGILILRAESASRCDIRKIIIQ